MTPQLADLTLEALKENWNLIPVLADLYDDLGQPEQAEKFRNLNFSEKLEIVVALDFIFKPEFNKVISQSLKVWRAYCEKNKDTKYWKEWIYEYCHIDSDQRLILKCVLDKNYYDSHYGIVSFQHALAIYRRRFINIHEDTLRLRHNFCLIMGDRKTAEMWRELRRSPWRLTKYELPKGIIA